MLEAFFVIFLEIDKSNALTQKSKKSGVCDCHRHKPVQSFHSTSMNWLDDLSACMPKYLRTLSVLSLRMTKVFLISNITTASCCLLTINKLLHQTQFSMTFPNTCYTYMLAWHLWVLTIAMFVVYVRYDNVLCSYMWMRHELHELDTVSDDNDTPFSSP